MCAMCASDHPDWSASPTTSRFSTAIRQASKSSVLSGVISRPGKSANVRQVPVMVVVPLAGVDPLGNRPVLVDPILRELGKNRLPARNVLGSLAFDEPGRLDEISKHLADQRDVHGGVHAHARRVTMSVDMPKRVVFRRVGGIIVEKAVGPLDKEVLVKRRNLAEEGNRALF